MLYCFVFTPSRGAWGDMIGECKMKSELTIGIMGGLVNNDNMGCQALTYSLLYELESIAVDLDINIKYIFFEYNLDEDGLVQISEELEIPMQCLEITSIGKFSFYKPKKIITSLVSWMQNSKMINEIKKCDAVIDITQGDSFTDIYGLDRFYILTSIKWLVEKLGCPLILAPQTYGPFNDSKVKAFAKHVINKADLVLSRDYESTQYLETFTSADVITVTDLAFALPFHKKNEESKADKIKIGINPSGLLSKSKTEGTALSSKMLADYDGLMIGLIDYLKKKEIYEIHLIPHVGDEAYICLPGIDGVIYHRAFNNPVEAKTTIAQMDVFIGARMHATIAAFSSGVPTIPIAYSKKFDGLFSSLGYNHVVDIIKLNTNKALEQIILDISNYKELRREVEKGMSIANNQRKTLKSVLEKALKDVKEKKLKR